MLPFEKIHDGDTFYVAIHAKYAERISRIMAAIQPSLAEHHIQHFRLCFMVFSDRIEQIFLFYETTPIIRAEQAAHDGGSLDPVIGIILADHASVRQRDRAAVFIVSDGNIDSHWNYGLLSQLIDAVWLNEPSEEPMVTPFGERQEIILEPATAPVESPLAEIPMDG